MAAPTAAAIWGASWENSTACSGERARWKVPVGFKILHGTSSSICSACTSSSPRAEPPVIKICDTGTSCWCSKKSRKARSSRPSPAMSGSSAACTSEAMPTLMPSASAYPMPIVSDRPCVMRSPPMFTTRCMINSPCCRTLIVVWRKPMSTIATASRAKLSGSATSKAFNGPTRPGITWATLNPAPRAAAATSSTSWRLAAPTMSFCFCGPAGFGASTAPSAGARGITNEQSKT